MEVIATYLLFFLYIPLGFIGLRLSGANNKQKYMAIEDSNYVKGLSAIGVFLAHTYYFIEENNCYIIKAFFPFSMLGGMGVLLFLFVGGYGIFKSVNNKEFNDKSYWKKRLLNIYLPSIVIEFIFSIITGVLSNELNALTIIKTTFLGAWYIDVVMLEYLFFYISFKVFSKQKNKMILMIFGMNVALFVIFANTSLNDRWKNGLFLYAFGVLVAAHEIIINKIIMKYKIIAFSLSILLFFATGVLFTIYKGSVVADLIKNISGCALAVVILCVIYHFKVGNSVVWYFGKRSLFIYLIHLGMLEIVRFSRFEKNIYTIYIILIVSIIMSEIGYRIHKKIITRINK